MNEDYELWNVWGVITKYLNVVSLKQHQSVYLVFTQFSKMMRLGWNKKRFSIPLPGQDGITHSGARWPGFLCIVDQASLIPTHDSNTTPPLPGLQLEKQYTITEH